MICIVLIVLIVLVVLVVRREAVAFDVGLLVVLVVLVVIVLVAHVVTPFITFIPVFACNCLDVLGSSNLPFLL